MLHDIYMIFIYIYIYIYAYAYVQFYIAAFIVMCLEIGIIQCLKFMLQFFSVYNTLYCEVIPCAVFSVQCLVLT